MAEFERGLIVERTQAGLEAARAKGHHGGRPRALSPEQTAHARKMFAGGDTVATIARVLGTSRPTVYRALEQPQQAGVALGRSRLHNAVVDLSAGICVDHHYAHMWISDEGPGAC